jgi:hypothetical protein
VLTLLTIAPAAAADKVGICHWAAAGKYVLISVSANSCTGNGHAGHANDCVLTSGSPCTLQECMTVQKSANGKGCECVPGFTGHAARQVQPQPLQGQPLQQRPQQPNLRVLGVLPGYLLRPV